RQLPVTSHASQRRQYAHVGDEEGADSEREPAQGFRNAPLDAGRATRDAPGSRRRERLATRVPGATRAEEERHLDSVRCTQIYHLANLAVGEHHHSAALRNPTDR